MKRTIKNSALAIVLVIILLMACSCGSGQLKCPSCGKEVETLTTAKDAAGVTHSWCSSCWNDYWKIMNPEQTDMETSTEAEVIPDAKNETDFVTEEPESAISEIWESTETPEGKPDIFEEDGRYGVRFDGEIVTDSIWQDIQYFEYNHEYYYLVTLNDKTGLMNGNGYLLVAPVWEMGYDAYHMQNMLLDRGYLVLVCKDTNRLYRIDNGNEIEIPKGYIDYWRDNILVTVSIVTFGDYNYLKYTVYNLETKEIVDEKKTYRGDMSEKNAYENSELKRSVCRTEEKIAEWRENNGYKIIECGDYGVIVEYSEYSQSSSVHPRMRSFYSQDGKLKVTGSSARVIWNDACDLLFATRSESYASLYWYTIYDLKNKGKVFFEGAKTRNNDTIPSISLVEGQRLMIAERIGGDDTFHLVLLNLTERTIVELPEYIKHVEPFSDGMAAVQSEDGKWGYINKNGALVYTCQYDEGRPFENGTVITILNYQKITLEKDIETMPDPKSVVKSSSGAEDPYEPEISEPTEEEQATWIEKTAKAQGMMGYVTVKVTIDQSSVVKRLEIDASSETKGLGQRVMEEGFTSQFIGKKGPFVYGMDDIDAVSGATITSRAVLAAVNEALGVTDESVEQKTDETNKDAFQYQSEQETPFSVIQVSANVTDGKITECRITSKAKEGSADFLTNEIRDNWAKAIVENGTAENDVITGATIKLSAEAVIKGVNDIMAQAGISALAEEPITETAEEPKEEPAETAEPEEIRQGLYGSFMAKRETNFSIIRVYIETEGKDIVGCRITSEDKSAGSDLLTDEIRDAWAKEIVENGTAETDVITSATLSFSSAAVIDAVNEILDRIR